MSLIAPALLAGLYNRPLLLDERSDIVTAALADPAFALLGARDEVAAFVSAIEGRSSESKGYDLVSGVALIRVNGVLVQELGCLRPFWGITGYDGIRENFLTALDDPEAKAIAFLICSPGGDVAGLFDLADEIYAARGVKPIWAILDEYAYSAGYGIACATDRIIVPRTGGTGSIGVIAMHVELSRMLDKEGVGVTVLRRGAHKAEVNSVEKLSDGAYERWMADINEVGEIFEEAVARNRGISASDIVAMQGETFMGAEGVRLGLADAVMAPAAAFQALVGAIA